MGGGSNPLFLVFDFGGVLTSNAFPGMAEYSWHVFDHVVQAYSRQANADEQGALNLIAPLLRPQVRSFFSAVNKFEAFTEGRSSFQQLECGHIGRGEYCRGFAARARVCVSSLYAKQIEKKLAQVSTFPPGVTAEVAKEVGIRVMKDVAEAFDIDAVMSILERSPLRRNVVELIDFIRRESEHVQSPSVIRVGLITNNWRGMGVSQGLTTAIQHVLRRAETPEVQPYESPFHVIVESCKEGQRKPDASIFKSARQRLLATIPGASQDSPTTMVFFDDLTPNCAGAMKSGVVSKAVLVRSPVSVFDGILAALEAHGHGTLAAGVRSRFTPSFASDTSSSSAVKSRDNYLYFPPPATPNLLPESKIPVKQRFSPDEKERLTTYLGTALPLHFPMSLQLVGDGGPVVVEYFKGGMSNPTFRLTLRTGSYVLRKQPKGKLLKGAHDIKREFYIMRHLKSKGTVPVPHALHLCEDATVLGTPFYVMKFVEGEVLRAPGIAAQPRGKEIVERLVDALAALHKAGPPPELKAPEGAEAGHPTLRVVKTWQRQYADGNKNLAAALAKKKAEGKPVGDDDGVFVVPDLEQLGNRLAEVLQSKAMPIQASTLVHGDYNFGNMIIDGLGYGQPNIAAILDFELSHVGDPLSDVGYMCVFYRLPNPIGFVGLPGVEKLPTVPEIITRYCAAANALSGVTEAQRKQIFSVYMAVAAFKIACITHGIVSRSRIGNASDVAAGLQFTAVCEVTSSVGLEILNEAKIPKQAVVVGSSKL